MGICSDRNVRHKTSPHKNIRALCIPDNAKVIRLFLTNHARLLGYEACQYRKNICFEQLVWIDIVFSV